MSCRYWRLAAALGGLALACSTVAHAQQQPSAADHHKPATKETLRSGQPAIAHSASLYETESLAVSRAANAIAARSAGATIRQADYSFWGVVLGGVAAFFTAIAATAAIFAAVHAKKAADHTEAGANEAKRSADAASESLKLSEITAKHQLRAYVMSDVVYLEGLDGKGPLEAHYQFKNFGQTPARNATIDMGAAIEKPSFQPDFTVKIFPDSSRDTIGPGSSRNSVKRIRDSLSGEELAAVKAGTSLIFFWGTISYDDVFGRPQTTQFSFMAGGRRINKRHDAGWVLFATFDNNTCS